MDKTIYMEEYFKINKNSSVGRLELRLSFEYLPKDENSLNIIEKECEEFIWKLKKKYGGNVQ